MRLALGADIFPLSVSSFVRSTGVFLLPYVDYPLRSPQSLFSAFSTLFSVADVSAAAPAQQHALFFFFFFSFLFQNKRERVMSVGEILFSRLGRDAFTQGTDAFARREAQTSRK